MSIRLRKRYFRLTFMGFGPKGNAILQEGTVCCRKMTEAVIEETRKGARQKAKEAGVDVEGMCLVNSLELEGMSESQEGGTK